MLAAQIESKNVRTVRNRLEQTEAAEPSISDHQRPRNRFAELKLQVPQHVFRESRAIREEFRSHTSRSKRLRLYFDV